MGGRGLLSSNDDARGRSWRRGCLAAGWVLAWALPAEPGALSGPVLDVGVTAVLEDVVTLPATGGSPRTRINMAKEAPDGSGRLFVNDLRGPLYHWNGTTLTTYLDVSAAVVDFRSSPGLASGLVSFAFHPDFATNGHFYTVHTADVGVIAPTHGPALATPITQHSVVMEWAATNPAASTFSGTSRELLRVASPSRFHNLGELAFDPHALPSDPEYGLLYIGGGDFGAVATGQPAQLQRLDTLYGSVLRIDPLGGTGAAYSYGVPSSNPYASDGDPNTFDEIYAHGFRNAHRVQFTEAFGGPFVSDIGESNLEEINALASGANYGWPEREGAYAIDVGTDPSVVFALPPNDASFGYRYPTAQYDHEEGSAIAGGVVYEGTTPSFLSGKFVFGDIVTGRLFYADAVAMQAADDGDPATTAPVFELGVVHGGAPTTLLEVVRAELGSPSLARVDLRFATDAAGTLYVTTKQDGVLRRLVAPPLPAVPGLPSPFAPMLLVAAVVAAAAQRTLARA